MNMLFINEPSWRHIPNRWKLLDYSTFPSLNNETSIGHSIPNPQILTFFEVRLPLEKHNYWPEINRMDNLETLENYYWIPILIVFFHDREKETCGQKNVY